MWQKHAAGSAKVSKKKTICVQIYLLVFLSLSGGLNLFYLLSFFLLNLIPRAKTTL